MKYMVFPTQAAARARSRSEAQKRNCGPVTTHWWNIVEGATGDFAIEIADKPKEEDNLDASDRSKLNPAFVRKAQEVV